MSETPSPKQRRVLMAVAGRLLEQVVISPTDQTLLQSVIDAGWLELHEIEAWGLTACLGEWRLTKRGEEALKSVPEPPK